MARHPGYAVQQRPEAAKATAWAAFWVKPVSGVPGRPRAKGSSLAALAKVTPVVPLPVSGAVALSRGRRSPSVEGCARARELGRAHEPPSSFGRRLCDSGLCGASPLPTWRAARRVGQPAGEPKYWNHDDIVAPSGVPSNGVIRQTVNFALLLR